MLSGRPQTFPLLVFAIFHDGRVRDVTSRATCHSGDDSALKVRPKHPKIVHAILPSHHSGAYSWPFRSFGYRLLLFICHLGSQSVLVVIGRSLFLMEWYFNTHRVVMRSCYTHNHACYCAITDRCWHDARKEFVWGNVILFDSPLNYPRSWALE